MLHCGNRDEQKIFQTFKQGSISSGECFFRYAVIGPDSFQHTFRDTINTSGIDLEGLEVSNQSLRVSAFVFHHKLGFIEEETGDC